MSAKQFHALGESLVALLVTVGSVSIVTAMVVQAAFWIVDTFILKGGI